MYECMLLSIGCDFVFHGFFCQDVQLENYLLMKQDTPLEEAWSRPNLRHCSHADHHIRKSNHKFWYEMAWWWYEIPQIYRYYMCITLINFCNGEFFWLFRRILQKDFEMDRRLRSSLTSPQPRRGAKCDRSHRSVVRRMINGSVLKESIWTSWKIWNSINKWKNADEAGWSRMVRKGHEKNGKS